VEYQNLVFSRHAIQQMFFRKISKSEVQTVIAYGKVIEQKPDDSPFPSYLLLDYVGSKPIHVVLSYDRSMDTAYVVTAYIPDPNFWTDDFRVRRLNR
jgi:hypothetical protein